MTLRRIYLEISNICNVQCSFCPIVERDKQRMSTQQIDAIFEKIQGKSYEVCLHLMGEPTAHSELIQILDLAQKYKILINLTTNGLLIKRYGEKLLNSKALRQINFSFQAYMDNFPHKSLAGYLDPIFEFTEEAFIQRPDLYINYRLWNIGEEQNSNEAFLRPISDFFKLEISSKVQVENIKSKKLINKLYLHFDSRFIWPSMEQAIKSEHGRCHGLKSHIGIHADGTVVPCCLDKEAVINLGNIHNESLEEIYAKNQTKKILNGFNQGRLVHELCKRCDYITRFNK